MVKISNNYELIGILFQDDFKRFKKGELINLGEDCYFEKTVIEGDIIFNFVRRENNNLHYILGKVYKKNNIEYNIQTIIGNNGAGKSTILRVIESFYKLSEKGVFGYSVGNLFFKINEKKYSIGDLYLKEDITIVLGSNEDIIYIVKKKLTFQKKSIRPIFLTKERISRTQKIDDFIKNDEKFVYLRDKILINTLKLTKNKKKIERIVKIKAISFLGLRPDHKDKILLLVKFFIVNSFLINYFSFKNEKVSSIDDDVLKFARDLYGSYYGYNEAKATINAYVVGLFFIMIVIDNNKHSINYFLYLHFYYQDIIFKGDYFHFYFDKVKIGKNPFINELGDNVNPLEQYKYNFFRKYHIELYHHLLENIDMLKYTVDDVILFTFLEKSILHEQQDIFNYFYDNNGDFGKKSYRDILYNEDNKIALFNRDFRHLFERLFQDVNIDIKKSELINRGNFTYFDYSYEKYQDFFKGFLSDINNVNIQDIDELYNDFELDIRVKKTNKDYFYLKDFSSGEKQLVGIINTLNDLFKKSDLMDEEITIILDEPEISLHIDWQRKFIYYLIDGINSILKGQKKVKINIYIATHSPFIISDLPKENIIFLHKNNEDDNTYVKTFDEIKKESNLIIDNTFIANIPELIRGPFFLDDVYGELGKEFINNIDFQDYDKAQELVGDKFLLKYLLLNKLKND